MDTETATARPPALLPVVPGLFTPADELGAPVQLVGVRCPACGALFLGSRPICANCSSPGLVEQHFGPEGTLHSFTFMPDAPSDDPAGGVYTVGQVEFPEGLRVQGRLRGLSPDAIRLDQPVRAVLGAIGRQDDGLLVSYVFVPGEQR
jgi:uncharacterized protein